MINDSSSSFVEHDKYYNKPNTIFRRSRHNNGDLYFKHSNPSHYMSEMDQTNSISRASSNSLRSQKDLILRKFQLDVKEEMSRNDYSSLSNCSRMRPLYTGNDDSNICHHRPPNLHNLCRESLRTPVKKVIESWPPKNENYENDNSEVVSLRSGSLSGHVKGVLKKLCDDQSVCSTLSNDNKFESRENSFRHSYNHFKRNGSFYHSISSRPSPSNFSHVKVPPKSSENQSVTSQEIRTNDAHSETLTNNEKENKLFRKNIGTTNPVGLLALVTRELSSKVNSSIFLKSSHNSQSKDSSLSSKKYGSEYNEERKSEEELPKNFESRESEDVMKFRTMFRNIAYMEKPTRRKLSLKKTLSNYEESKIYRRLSTSSSDQDIYLKSQFKEKNLPKESNDALGKSFHRNEKDRKFWTFTTSVVLPKEKTLGNMKKIILVIFEYK